MGNLYHKKNKDGNLRFSSWTLNSGCPIFWDPKSLFPDWLIEGRGPLQKPRYTDQWRFSFDGLKDIVGFAVPKLVVLEIAAKCSYDVYGGCCRSRPPRVLPFPYTVKGFQSIKLPLERSNSRHMYGMNLRPFSGPMFSLGEVRKYNTGLDNQTRIYIYIYMIILIYMDI